MARDALLDPVDWRILRQLQDDASVTNKELAARVGLPTSSCHERVRRLRTIGVITAVRAVVDPAAVGRGLHAFIAIQLRPHRRELVESFTTAVLALPETLALYNVSGPEDFFVHVAVADSAPAAADRRPPRHPARGRPRPDPPDLRPADGVAGPPDTP
jgi:DNA-binding Lrp family transcriptional regulator